MEAELVRSRNDMMCLNNQLLEAIQRKLELSQELEAWQVGKHSHYHFHTDKRAVCVQKVRANFYAAT